MVRVFNGMDLANFPAPTAQTANPVPRIVSTGRLIEFKGFHHLIAACAKLQWRGLDFTCEIIGEGPWRPQLQGQIEELGLGERVRLAGARPQEEVFAALRGCDIFALPCIVDRNGASDVFPTVILEAMASAKPVVSTQLAGVPEQVEHDRTGLLVPPGDEAALADTLARLIESPDLRRALGQAGRARLESEFAVEKTVLPLKALYERHVPASTAPTRPRVGWACLLEKWPASEEREAELRQLREANPALRIYVAEASSAAPPEGATESLAHLDFLPDGMVLEAEWQQERELARRLETNRAELGQKLSSEYFLQQARRAVVLRRWIVRDGVRHLHATSPAELLCGWLLHRLCGVTLSVSVGEKTEPLAGSILARLARECAGVRLTAAQPEWLTELQKLPGKPEVAMHRVKRGKDMGAEWLAHLAAWGVSSENDDACGAERRTSNVER
jgi:hypothetical protein